MVGIGFSDRLEEEPGLLDVVDVATVGRDHRLEIGQVA